MIESKQAYKTCLIDHPGNLKTCEAQRLSYEADVNALAATNTSAAPPNNGKN